MDRKWGLKADSEDQREGPSISIHLARGKCPTECRPETQEKNGGSHEGTRKDLLAGNDTD